MDAYVAGSLQDITPVNTYVNRIIDSGSFAYGVVLSGKVVRLQKACSEYIQTNKAMISDLIKKNIKPLQVRIYRYMYIYIHSIAETL